MSLFEYPLLISAKRSGPASGCRSSASKQHLTFHTQLSDLFFCSSCKNGESARALLSTITRKTFFGVTAHAILVYNHPAARGILGLRSARVPPKLSKDCRLRSSRSPRTVLVARGRTLNPVCREQRVIITL